jgi:branched-subunit amino acid aminotransferase/4-amino-4-deoxychorismate lyase
MLPGVTRGAVLELARADGLAAREVSLPLEELRGAGEAILTNAVGGVMPLVSVDRQKVGSGVPGKVTRRLRALYEAVAAAQT